MLNALLNPLVWLLPVAIAFVAVVFADVRPIWFNPWYNFLLWLETKTNDKVTKPIGGCAMCTAGMATLITSLVVDWTQFLAHITSACLAVLIAPCLTKLYKWTQN